MKSLDHSCIYAPGFALLLALGFAPVSAQTSPATLPPGAAAVILALENDVQVKGRGNTVFNKAHTNQFLEAGDSLKTGRRSSAVLRYADSSVLRIDQNFAGQIHAPVGRRSVFESLKGRLFFLHRGGAADTETRTPSMSALILGTEFVLEVEDDGTSTLSLIDGQVAVTNESGGLTLESGEQAVAAPGQPPRRTSRLDATNVLQWCLYYPAVLRLEELAFSDAERSALATSLEAYRNGDLPAALAAYPSERQPAGDDERLFLAALLLVMGQIREAESLLDALKEALPDARLYGPASALRTLIAAVNGRPVPSSANNQSKIGNSPSALLAQSYLHQAHADLPAALAAARQAADAASNFSFAQARRAELEFSFGRIGPAREAIEKSLALASRNAQAHAMRGFLLAAHNRTREAIGAFDQALAIDSRLGNAWLGRGLCRIKQGDGAAGRQDLQIAAAVEPTRAVLRSYLGKAFDHEGDLDRARHELTLARRFDPNDPTAWLYSALMNQRMNRINEGIRDLEHAQTLGGNRRVERSSLLVDQDDAVRGANLALLYRDAGLSEVSQREAARAVNTDYANYSAHLFLADSFNELRDPRQFNLRYETPWLSEYLVANLLAPVGAGTLSPLVTQQEYSRLFDRNRLGFASATDYRSSGDWFQSAVQHGAYENFSYAAEVVYRSENGDRPNSDVEQRAATLRLKHQFTPADSLFAQATLYRGEGGDVRPLYDPRSGASLTHRTEELQTPLLLAGWNHQWRPGMNTLVLAGMVDDTFNTRDASNSVLLIEQVAGTNLSVVPGRVGQSYRTEVLTGTAELQQLFRLPSHTALFGGRYQAGEFTTRNADTITADSFVVGGIPVISPGAFTNTTQRIDPRFERWSVYAYDYWRALEPLTLIGGLSYDTLRSPENFLHAPVTAGEKTTDQLSPKAGLVWTPHRTTTVRAAYSRSLGGVAQDRSFQLEPSQVAGIIQSYRGLIPEAVAGTIAAQQMDVFGMALDQKFTSGTYVGLHAEWLESDASRRSGAYVTRDSTGGLIALPGGTRERFDYVERSFSATVDQLIGREWSLGARYRVSVADLTDDFTDLHDPPVVAASGFKAEEDVSATLHQVLLRAVYNHPTGFFGQLEAVWSAQANHGYSPALPGDDFWQFNALAGYRLPNRRVELRLGLLNLTGRDYRLNPLNVTGDLPRERTFYAGLRFHF